MEVIVCKKYCGRIELPVAAQYYGQDNVCLSCPNHRVCKEEMEEQELYQANKEE